MSGWAACCGQHAGARRAGEGPRACVVGEGPQIVRLGGVLWATRGRSPTGRLSNSSTQREPSSVVAGAGANLRKAFGGSVVTRIPIHRSMS